MTEDMERRLNLHHKMMKALDAQASKGIDGVLAGNFYNEHLFLAIYALIVKTDITDAKQNFSVCGMLDVLKIRQFNNRLLDYGIPNMCYAVLSDNHIMISDYATLSYKGDGKNYPDMEVLVEKGELPVYCNSIQMIIKKDWNGLKRNIDIMESITKIKYKVMRLDLDFFKSVRDKDKGKAEEVLNELVSPKMHALRNDDILFSKYVSQPALGYAKLAWMNGLEVQVDSPLVPRELLPVKPLHTYQSPYGFL